MKIERLPDPQRAAEWCEARRAAGASLGFVPTMGALHAGHLSLVSRALEENELACVSVFVNPLQFDEASDLTNYPRDLDGDAEQLERVGCQMVFTGTLAQFFPGELRDDGTLPEERLLDPGPSALGLEGACRSGHFEGVATIVDRLFEVVRPDAAYFGQKDFQQSLVVSDLAVRRGGPRVVVCPISREPSGLARSSRNERLSPKERVLAACLSGALAATVRVWREGERDAGQLEALLHATLEQPGVLVEYATLRERHRWSASPPSGDLEQAVALVAARIGAVRLIDNHLLDEEWPLPASPEPES